MGDQDGGPFGGHAVGLEEEVGEDGAAGGESDTDLILEGVEVDSSLHANWVAASL